jgi:hypothetical protein
MRAFPCPTVRGVLYESKGVLRLEELLEETAMDELAARRVVDDLVISGEVERTPVGNHVMLRRTEAFSFQRDVVEVSPAGDKPESVS